MPPYVVIACSVVFFWNLSARTIIYTAMPTIAAELELTSSWAGTVISSFVLGVTAASWASGWLPGSRKMRILGSTVLAMPMIALVSASGDVWMLLGSGVALGFAIGVYRPIGLSLVVEAGGDHKQARYMSVHETSASLASFFGAAWVAATIGLVSWRASLLLWGVAGVAAVLVFARVDDKRGAAAKGALSESPPLDIRVVHCVATLVACNILLGGLFAVLPLIMVRAWGIDQAYAAWVVGTSRLVNLLGVFLVGARGDRWGHIRTTRGLQILGVVGLVAMSVPGYGPLFLAGLAAISVAGGGAMTLLPSVVAEAYPHQQRERALSYATGASSLLGSVACPPVFGALLDAGLPNAPMILTAVLGILGIYSIGRLESRSAALERA